MSQYKLSITVSIFHSLASTHLNYCITTRCTTIFSKVTEIQSLCNRILRLICRRNPRDNINDIHKIFAILEVRDKFKFEICYFVYKFLHRMLPHCLNNFFQRNSKVHSRQTRQSNNLHLPLFKKTLASSQSNWLALNYGMKYLMKYNQNT